MEGVAIRPTSWCWIFMNDYVSSFPNRNGAAEMGEMKGPFFQISDAKGKFLIFCTKRSGEYDVFIFCFATPTSPHFHVHGLQ